MTTTVLKFAALGVGALFLIACGPATQAGPAPAVDQTPPTTTKPEVSINEVMVALVDHAGHNLWEVEREGKAPKTEADWQNVWEHAVQIAAAGPAISAGGVPTPNTAVAIK